MHYIKISSDDWEERERELLERKELENQLMKAELDAVRIRNNTLLARVQKLEADFERLYGYCERTLVSAIHRWNMGKWTLSWFQRKLGRLTAGQWDDHQQ